jgi:uncharacterized membrane protein SpoIIM required for sporulation
MDLSTFLQTRRSDWLRLEELLQFVEGSGLSALDDDQAVEFGRLYRRTASDLNQAQTFVSGDSTQRYLNDLVARAYLAIYGKAKVDLWGLFLYLVWGYPAVFRRYLPQFLLATALFAGGAIFGFVAVKFDKDVASAFLLPSDMPTVRPRGEGADDPTPAQTTGEFARFSAQLFTNNLGVSLFAFALGMTFGIGTAWVLFYNGVLMGALGAVFHEAHRMTQFATDVLPHGVLEIPAAILGGAAGFVLAQGCLRARPWSRSEELARSGKEALRLVFGCVPLLAFAGVLEAGVARAPDRFISSGAKLAVAGVFGLLFAAYVLLLGWGRKSSGGAA